MMRQNRQKEQSGYSLDIDQPIIHSGSVGALPDVLLHDYQTDTLSLAGKGRYLPSPLRRLEEIQGASSLDGHITRVKDRDGELLFYNPTIFTPGGEIGIGQASGRQLAFGFRVPLTVEPWTRGSLDLPDGVWDTGTGLPIMSLSVAGQKYSWENGGMKWIGYITDHLNWLEKRFKANESDGFNNDTQWYSLEKVYSEGPIASLGKYAGLGEMPTYYTAIGDHIADVIDRLRGHMGFAQFDWSEFNNEAFSQTSLTLMIRALRRVWEVPVFDRDYEGEIPAFTKKITFAPGSEGWFIPDGWVGPDGELDNVYFLANPGSQTGFTLA